MTNPELIKALVELLNDGDKKLFVATRCGSAIEVTDMDIEEGTQPSFHCKFTDETIFFDEVANVYLV